VIFLYDCPCDLEELIVGLRQEIPHSDFRKRLRGHLQLASNGPALGLLLGSQLQGDRHTNLEAIMRRSDMSTSRPGQAIDAAVTHASRAISLVRLRDRAVPQPDSRAA
jgi:hypothetical protein